jgi:hypothetical protein
MVNFKVKKFAHVAWIAKRRNVYIILVGNPLGKRSLRRPRGIWERNIMEIGYIQGCDVDEHASKSFLTGRLERELQMIQLSATRCSCIAIL